MLYGFLSGKNIFLPVFYFTCAYFMEQARFWHEQKCKNGMKVCNFV